MTPTLPSSRSVHAVLIISLPTAMRAGRTSAPSVQTRLARSRGVRSTTFSVA
ncbi:hypothetical protein IEO21_10166 [Rhodonia placenta]|uniref:Uncharacterized protein n=1 Tax=Rhodonia placenta TaxID=104341 RepID=A0A8H7NT03_9APHY|nr:hypothetical protein IEO21_10166 [Postia placenta]